MTTSSVDSLLKDLVTAAAGNKRLEGLDSDDVETLVRILLKEQFSSDRKAAQDKILESVTAIVDRVMEVERDET